MRCMPFNVALSFHLYLQKYVPLDLRPKKTRAIRKRMTKHQVSCYIHVALIAWGGRIAVGFRLIGTLDSTTRESWPPKAGVG